MVPDKPDFWWRSLEKTIARYSRPPGMVGCRRERESEKMREGGRFELATKPRLTRQATQIVFSPFLGVRGSRSAPWMSISCEDRKKGIF